MSELRVILWESEESDAEVAAFRKSDAMYLAQDEELNTWKKMWIYLQLCQEQENWANHDAQAVHDNQTHVGAAVDVEQRAGERLTN